MKLKIITIDRKQYILHEDNNCIAIYNSDGEEVKDKRIIGEVTLICFKYSSEEIIKNTKSEKYLVYDNDDIFGYKLMYLKYVNGKYYEDNGRELNPNISIELKADEEVENRIKERENKIFEYEQKIEETNDSFYDFIDRKRKDIEQESKK